MAYKNSLESDNTFSWISFSGLIHALLAAAILAMELSPKISMPPVIEVEFIATGTPASAIISEASSPGQTTVKTEKKMPKAPMVKIAKAPNKQVVKTENANVDVDALTDSVAESLQQLSAAAIANPLEVPEDDLKSEIEAISQQEIKNSERLLNSEKALFASELAEESSQAEAEMAKMNAQVAAEGKRLAALLAQESAQRGGIYGMGAPVRALSELRQMPGNKRPEYSSEDRLAGKQGSLALLAYVSKGGELTQFKLVQGTGHRSLDLKTLQALKKWRFFPGQEGWVEIPFRWDLRGGPKEMPATLRRSLSQR